MINIFVLFLIFFPLLMGIIGYFVGKKCPKIREWFFIGTNLIEMIVMIVLAIIYSNADNNEFAIKYVVGLGLSFKVDTFRVIYATISIFLWLMTITFSKEYMHHYHAKERYYLFYLVTLAGVVGVFFSNDFFTTFCFFELMSFASYPLVIHEEKEDAMKAGETYLAVAVISGMVLLVGLFLIYYQTNTLSFNELREYFETNSLTSLSFVGGILVLLGFGAKAGMYPLHIWLPKAHPVAPAPASALLSGILTKTGVFGIIAISANIFIANTKFAYILLALAVITMFLGAFLALFSTNLKRTLACSSMSQIGFILVGVSFMVLLGEEGGLASCGALLHMVNHSLIKLVLFMAAGVVAMNLHALDLNDIKGFGRKKPFLMIVFLIGTLGIMGIPLFNGYVSKTMIHEAIVEYIHEAHLVGSSLVIFKSVEWIFLISGGLTIAYMTKLFVCLFVEKNNDEEKQKAFDDKKNYLSPLSKAVFVISVIALPIIGILPNIVNQNIIANAYEFFNVERFTHEVEFFGFESLKGALISISIGVAVYFLVIRLLLIKDKKYINPWPKYIDMENYLYRPILTTGTVCFIKYFVTYLAYFFEYFIIYGTLYFILYFVRYLVLVFDYIVYFLRKTILKNHVYRYKEFSASKSIGQFMDKHAKNKPSHYYEDKLASFSANMSHTIDEERATYSYAFAMIALGIIIVLVFAIVVSL